MYRIEILEDGMWYGLKVMALRHGGDYEGWMPTYSSALDCWLEYAAMGFSQAMLRIKTLEEV